MPFSPLFSGVTTSQAFSRGLDHSGSNFSAFYRISSESADCPVGSHCTLSCSIGSHSTLSSKWTPETGSYFLTEEQDDEWGPSFGTVNCRDTPANVVFLARGLLRTFHRDHPAGFNRWREVTLVVQELRSAQYSALNPMLAQLLGDLGDALQVARLTNGYEEAERRATCKGLVASGPIKSDAGSRSLQVASNLQAGRRETARMRVKLARAKTESRANSRTLVASKLAGEGKGTHVSSSLQPAEPQAPKRVAGRGFLLLRLLKPSVRAAAKAAPGAWKPSCDKMALQLSATDPAKTKRDAGCSRPSRCWPWIFHRRSAKGLYDLERPPLAPDLLQ